jgi:serine/threonine protein kinase
MEPANDVPPAPPAHQPGFFDNLLHQLAPQLGAIRDEAVYRRQRQRLLDIMSNVFLRQPSDNGFSDRYDNLQFLSSGGFGAVWKAYDTVTGQDVAVKWLIPNPKFDPKDFQKEYHILQRCQREPNIVQLVSPGWIHLSKHPKTRSAWMLPEDVPAIASPDWYGVVMKLYTGDLNHLIGTYGRTGKVFGAIFAQCVSAVQQFHKHGYTHQDIKPDNFLYQGDTVVLSDVGVAMETKAKDPHRNCALYGTYLYMSLAQVERKGVHGRCFDMNSDYESLANALYELFVDKLPWQDVLDRRGVKATYTLRKKFYDAPPTGSPDSIEYQIKNLGYQSRRGHVPYIPRDQVRRAKRWLYELTGEKTKSPKNVGTQLKKASYVSKRVNKKSKRRVKKSVRKRIKRSSPRKPRRASPLKKKKRVVGRSRPKKRRV